MTKISINYNTLTKIKIKWNTELRYFYNKKGQFINLLGLKEKRYKFYKTFNVSLYK